MFEMNEISLEWLYKKCVDSEKALSKSKFLSRQLCTKLFAENDAVQLSFKKTNQAFGMSKMTNPNENDTPLEYE